MRCECCNTILTETEQKIIFTVSETQANACLRCLKTMDVKFKLPRSTADEYEEEFKKPHEEEPPLYDDQELWDER